MRVTDCRLTTIAAAVALLLPVGAFGQEGEQIPVLTLPRSIEVRVPGAYVRTSPSEQGARRGTLAFGARIRPLDLTNAGGCDSPWYRIGPEAWVCGEYVRPRSAEPDAPQLPVVEEGQLVPHSYGFARDDGARVFKTLEGKDVELGEMKFGDVFGELAVFANQPRSASIEAITQVTVLVVTRQHFEEDLGMSFWLGLFVKTMAERFREMSEKAVELERLLEEAG